MNAALEAITLGGLHDRAAEILRGRVRPGSSLLDLGAGQGAWVRRMQRAGFKPVGIDRNRENFGASEVEFVEADLDGTFLPLLGGRTYDVITAIEVIEHLESPAAFLRQCCAALAPSGVLLVTTPNIESVGARLRFLATGELRMFGRDPMRNDPTHISPIHSAIFEKLAARAGLRVDLHDSDALPAANRLGTRALVRLVAPLLRGYQGNNCHIFVLRHA